MTVFPVASAGPIFQDIISTREEYSTGEGGQDGSKYARGKFPDKTRQRVRIGGFNRIEYRTCKELFVPAVCFRSESITQYGKTAYDNTNRFVPGVD